VEIILIELLLWAGLIFFFWALKDGLNHVESELESQGLGAGINATPASASNFDRAEKVSEPIGRYCDAPIYRYAVIGGKNYQFVHILPSGLLSTLDAGERCLAPGLVYSQSELLARS
jgi:hypothetical protein